jgi:hypothetical protein
LLLFEIRIVAVIPATRLRQGFAGGMTVGRRSFSEGAKRGSSIPETPAIEPKGRCVLDRPVKPDDDNLYASTSR